MPPGWALPALDFVVLAVAFGCAWASTSSGAGLEIVLGLFPAFGVAALAARGAYAPRLRLVVLDSLGLAMGSISVAAMCTLAVGLLVRSRDPASDLLFREWLLGLILVGAVRLGFTLWQYRRRVAGAVARRTVIVGAGEVGARIGRRLATAPVYGLSPIGFIDDDPPEATDVGGRPAPVLGSTRDLAMVVESHGIEHIVLAFSGAPDGEMLGVLRRCLSRGVSISLIPRFFDLINTRMITEPVGGMPVATLQTADPVGLTFMVKHAIDRAVAVVLIIILAPLLLVISAMVKFSSGGPVLFRQRRIGRDEEPFDLLKFRTMTPGPGDSDFVPAAGLAPGGVEGMDRRTRVGRWLRRMSLDELPQLFNVGRGQMSLVGPRPERPEYADIFAERFARYHERHRVRVGMTGLSQVHGLRGQSSIADRVELDNYYIENWSLGLDLKILLMTVIAVLRAAD